MRVNIVYTWADFIKLKEEWTELLRNSGADTVFLTWEWANVWQQIFGNFFSPWIVCVREKNGSLVGLASFYRKRYALFKKIHVYVLQIIGDHETGAEYQSLIIAKGREKEVGRVIFQAILNEKRYWDFIWLPNLPGWNSTVKDILEICREMGLYSKFRSVDFSVIPLSDSFQNFKKTLSRNQRIQVKRNEMKILKGGEIKIHCCASSCDLPLFQNALFSLHLKRWQKKGNIGAFLRYPGMRLFYERFTAVALQEGWLRFFSLEHRGEIRAVQIGYTYKNIFHQLQEGFDPDYLSGTGNVLRSKVIELCIAEGNIEYDFLGGLSEHKRKWGALPRIGHSLFIANRKIKNSLIFAGGIWPTGRFLTQERCPISHPDT